MAMALDERNEQSDSFDDPEATTNLQNSFDRSTRIVNSVPGCGHRSQRNSVTRRDSVGSDSMSSVPLRRNSGIVTDSANSSEGFSLADDTGDSLPGSEVFSEGTQSQSLSTPSSQSAAAGPSKVLAAQEILLPLSYRVVQGARRCFWLIWIVGTVSVTTSLWAMARNEWDDRMMEIEIIIEQSQDVSKMIFEQMIFESQVTLLEQLWKARLESKLQAMETLTTTMTSTAAIEEMNWPYVTLPDFSRRVANMQGFTFWMPLIQRGSDDMDATTWGNYSQEHLDDWLYRNDSLARRERQQIRHLQDAGDNLTDIVSDEIFQTRPDGSIHASDTSSSHFFPIWHHAHPIVPSLINYDLLSHAQLGPSLQAVLQTKQPVLTKTFLKSNVPEGDFFLLSTLRDNLPTMFLFYPIFEKLKSEGVQLKVAGVLASSISWEDILKAKNILISPLQVNIPAASCSNQTDDNGQDIFVQLAGQNSISLLGSNLTSAGSGYQRFQNWVDLTADIDYYGEPLLLDASSGGCAYDLQLIQEGATDIGGIKVDEENRVPTNIVIGTLAFALAVALAFVYFERTVQDRDRALTQEATRTRNIVASLFPSQFHDRLFQSNADGLNNAIPKNEDFQRVFHGVEAAMSSHFELPLEDEDVSNFEVPLKAEDNFEAKGINNFESQQNTGAPPPRARSLSNDRMNHKQSNRGDSLSQSTHSKSRSSPLKHFVPKPSSFRSVKRTSGGSVTEQSSMQHSEHDDGNSPIATARPGFGRDFLSRATSIRNIGQTRGAENSLMGRSEHGSADSALISRDEPIADLFPEATVIFADISGFTAWSSAREPAQVFKLLETVYRSFDRIARKQRVFKVETIGDCYMAVTGVPDSQPDHAVIMAQFAKECMIKMRDLTRKLEVSLGPETGDLCMRFGLHSGPVTAGVLRGEKSRFQLFGDTVNFASRMESTGQPNRIQASRATADLLIDAGKENWVQAREELVNAKGKGMVQTYWILPRSNCSSSGSVTSLNDSVGSIQGPLYNREQNSSCDSLVQLKSRTKKSFGSDSKSNSLHSAATSDHTFDSSRRNLLTISQHSQVWAKDHHIDEHLDEGYDGFEDDGRQERLIDWNVKILASILKRIQASRQEGIEEVTRSPKPRRGRRLVEPDLVFETKDGETAFDEIMEIIPLAKMLPCTNEQGSIAADDVDLSIKVESQLREYVTTIALMYRDNFFHNFEHASCPNNVLLRGDSHVLMSSQKLLHRVINADKNGELKTRNDHASIIASDPLTQFAIVFAALIHDVDHTGVPNLQLVREKAHVALLYKNRSIAEQNSLELAWDLLMSKEYRDLQRAIFANQDELTRLRQLIVNVVLATDIFDPDMVNVRNSRWDKAFGNNTMDSELSSDDIRSLKATIVIEYIMQASDVSHTMQHWHVYLKWNERLFEEMYSAFQVGRGDKDPSIGWYRGELWFFDNYVIPLARKLKDCEVFGAASSQFLKYALDNREEWETKGEGIVESFVGKHSKPL